MKREKQLQNNINDIDKRLERFERIVEYARENEITCRSYCNCSRSLINITKVELYTYIYMNKKEYKINQLYLHNPEFIRTNTDDVIMIKDVFCDGSLDYKRVKEYTVDLKHRTYIVMKDDVLKE